MCHKNTQGLPFRLSLILATKLYFLTATGQNHKNNPNHRCESGGQKYILHSSDKYQTQRSFLSSLFVFSLSLSHPHRFLSQRVRKGRKRNGKGNWRSVLFILESKILNEGPGSHIKCFPEIPLGNYCFLASVMIIFMLA